MKKLILVLLFTNFVNLLFAYPIDPRPLRRLVEESEYIVSGHVVDIVHRKNKKEMWNDAIAVVRIRHVLKGSITESVIEIPFPVGLICPAPPRYEKNTDIIAFLDKEGKTYQTHALSYGLKSGSSAELEIYEARIREIVPILLIKDENERFMATVEWIVKCTEDEVTRWEGTYELSPESDFMSYYARSEQPAYSFMLSADQKVRLKNALLSTQNISYADMGLIDLVYPDNREEVYNFVLRSLEKLNGNNIWAAESYMQRILYAKSTLKMESLLKDFQEIQFDQNKEEEMLAVVHEFVTLAKN